ncbi:MAG: hypothetical protein KDA88_16370 [Planctomycetaceae bacterium]|nr:hypothetical protein [Planctomycetaceae bacterium]MCB9950642.1 hypothetical protein [Planctomycetaceae bacterium]
MRILSSLNRKSNGRSGASLTEVLIAILILSIGVSSVFALFPISILSSIKATQLTNAKLMQGNVEQYLRTNPGYLTVNTASGVAQGNAWQARWTYNTNDVVVPTPKNGSYRSEPFRAYRAIALQWLDSNPAGVTVVPAGPSGLKEPNWSLQSFGPYRVAMGAIVRTGIGGGDFQNNVVAWEPVDNPVWANTLNPTILPYNSWVVDPLGAATFGPVGDQTLLGNAWGEFGCYSTDVTGAVPDSSGTIGVSVSELGLSGSGPLAGSIPSWTRGLPRVNAGIPTDTIAGVDSAYSVAAHPDAWSESTRVIGISDSSLPANVIQLEPTSGLFVGNRFIRVVIRNSDGTRSVTRGGTPVSFNNNQLTFGEAIPAVIRNDLGEVSVEEFDSRYTWIATINNSIPNNPTIKMVVLFKRKFLPGEEHVYRAVFANDPVNGPYTPTDTVLLNGWTGPPQNDQIYISWGANEPRPFIQEGKYVMRARPDGPGVEWYEIVSSTIDEGNRSAVITVDRAINSPTFAGNATRPIEVDRVVLLRGIVEMFDL